MTPVVRGALLSIIRGSGSTGYCFLISTQRGRAHSPWHLGADVVGVHHATHKPTGRVSDAVSFPWAVSSPWMPLVTVRQESKKLELLGEWDGETDSRELNKAKQFERLNSQLPNCKTLSP